MKKLLRTITLIILMVLLTSCNLWENDLGKLKEAFAGRDAIIQSYDDHPNIIDRIEGSSISISADDTFDTKNSDGETTKKSSVISFTVGGKQMTHVGSSLILHEKGLRNVFEDYAKTVDIQNMDRSVPFINGMVNSFKNITVGHNKIILIRSQTGQPLATFVGESVSYFATDIDKSTGFIIDGKYLFIYRCDYTVYDSDLFK